MEVKGLPRNNLSELTAPIIIGDLPFLEDTFDENCSSIVSPPDSYSAPKDNYTPKVHGESYDCKH